MSAPPGAVHGVLVTYDRPDSLAHMVAQLEAEGITSLTVVDNAPSDASRAAATGTFDGDLAYLPQAENTGPAGGIAAGMRHVLGHARDDDWIVVLDDDRLTGSPGALGRLHAFAEGLVAAGEPVGAVGIGGARFDRRRGRLRRLADADLDGAPAVDYVAGGQLMTIRVAAAREVGVFDPALFFAFDDLDFCLRLQRAGYRAFVYGAETLLSREFFGRLGPDVRPLVRRATPWRRYYSVRNHIVIMRRYASWPSAILVTVEELLGRPLADLARRRGRWWSMFAAGVRGAADAWAGRLGRRMEAAPTAAAGPRRKAAA
jgi:glycosyltransferase involved in cell wall biosynthesis